jgi:hypothetical protein
MKPFAGERRILDPEYFSLTVRCALREDELEAPEPSQDHTGVSVDEFDVLAAHPEVIEAGAVVVDAEAAVLAAEDAGVPDELAMRRLDKARAAERAVLTRLQRRRAMAHTAPAVSRTAQVVPLHAARSAQVRGFGGAA